MLEVSGLSCGYGDIIAVRDLSFSVEAGRILALLGANGAGKTSTLMCLVGIVTRKAGRIMLAGADITAAQLAEGTERVYDYFPRLRERRSQLAGSLSGGEQQMLAMGRALISGPKLILVDELSLGLMPKVVDECYAVLHKLKEAGVAIILVEQNTERALAAADEVCVLEAGNLSWRGSASEAHQNENLVAALLGQ